MITWVLNWDWKPSDDRSLRVCALGLGEIWYEENDKNEFTYTKKIKKSFVRNGNRKEKNMFTVPVPVGRIRFKEKLYEDAKNEFTYMKN